MNVQRIADMVRRKAVVNSVQYNNTDLLEDLNELKDELWSAIAHRLQDDYNWERWFASSVAGQSEYTVPTAASNLSGLKTIKGVAVKYGNGDDFDKATLVNPQTLPKHWDWYVANQPTEKPLYFVSDRSVFIAPAPKNSEAQAIELSGLRNIVDWTIDTDESEMRIPVDFQRVLVYGLMPRALTSKGSDLNEIIQWDNMYSSEREKALKNMSNRVDSAVILQYPDDISTDDTIIKL